MFLLIPALDAGETEKNGISIHLMFLLIDLTDVRERKKVRISIHLMFLLIEGATEALDTGQGGFQYISCFY